MKNMRIYDLSDWDLPENLYLLREIFLYNRDPRDGEARKPDETLHSYLTRKGIVCFCKSCRKKRNKEVEKNTVNVLEYLDNL